MSSHDEALPTAIAYSHNCPIFAPRPLPSLLIVVAYRVISHRPDAPDDLRSSARHVTAIQVVIETIWGN